MKRFQYLLLLSICFGSSAFASGFNLFSNSALTCPSSFPSFVIWNDRVFPHNEPPPAQPSAGEAYVILWQVNGH